MAINVAPWVKETCTTTGTGSLVLSGKVDSFMRFSSALSAGDEVWYAVLDSNGNRETGRGTFDGINTVSRDTVTATLDSGAYDDTSPTPINLSGTSVVICTLTAAAYEEMLTDIVNSFDMDNMTEGSDTKIMTAAERTKLTANRTTLVADLTLYVDGTTGSDSNDGLTSGTAFQTIQKAINYAASLDLSVYDVYINVADGTYAEFTLKSLVGTGTVFITGNVATVDAVTISSVGGTNCVYGNNYLGTYEISYMKLVGASLNIQIIKGFLNFHNIEFGAATTAHIQLSDKAVINVLGDYSISAGSGRHIWCIAGSMFNFPTTAMTVTITNIPDFTNYFIQATTQSYLFCNAAIITFSGAATGIRFRVANLSVIATFSSDLTYFPGDSDGVIVDSSIYNDSLNLVDFSFKRIEATVSGQWLLKGKAISTTAIRFVREIQNAVRPTSITLSSAGDFDITGVDGTAVTTGVSPVFRGETSTGVLVTEVTGLTGLTVGETYMLTAASATSFISWN